MSDSFEKLKKRFLINAVIVSVVCGVSAGVFCAFAVLLALKLSGIAINAGFYVLIGFGVAAACGGVLFLALRPTDKKVAKKLDNEYSLGERAQTMVEFGNSEGEIIALQRADATERLAALPKKSYFSGLVKIIAIPVLAIAMLFTGTFVNGASANPNVDPPVSITDMQKRKLSQLIEDVKKSDLEEGVSASVVVVLEELLDGVDDFKVESVMKSSVISAVTVIDQLFAAENSFVKINVELSKYDKTSLIATSILKGAISYKSSTKIKTLAKVNSLAESGDAIISEYLTAGIKQEREILCGNEETEGLRDRALKAEITEFLNSYNAALEASGYAETDDALFAALNTLSVKLEGYGESAVNGGYSPATLWDYIGGAMDEFVNSGTVALSVQMYNCMMDEFVRENLAEIFGLRSSELPAQDTVVPDDPGTPPGLEDPEKPNEGSPGPGDPEYGSKDIIYDHEKEANVEYGPVFTEKYYPKMQELVNSGKISDELISILNEYFRTLNEFRDKDNNDNN